MDKKLLLLFLTSIMLLAGCNDVNSSSLQSNESSSVVPNNAYQIKIIDIDGQELGSKTISLTENTSVWEDLKTNFDVNYTDGEYGAYIKSINGSIIDGNYYMSIYENNTAAATGVEGLVADDKDVFEFKVECWNTIASGYGTMDEYDLLVDKAIYGYMKTLDLSTSTTYADSTYWDLMTINLAKNNYYDSNVFNYNSISQTVKDEVESIDITTLTGANIYKYFLYANALEKDLTSFKNHVTNYVESLQDSYSSYVTPFVVAACYGLDINSTKLDTLTSIAISTDLTWGPDVSVWQYVTSILYNDTIDTTMLSTYISSIDYGNCNSNALVLQAFAAVNENIRDSKYEVNGKDLIEVLFDNYYNVNSNEIEYTKGVENTYSKNQVTASLMAYKVCRDSGKKANIYG